MSTSSTTNRNTINIKLCVYKRRKYIIDELKLFHNYKLISSLYDHG